jgi:hypothetical protein
MAPDTNFKDQDPKKQYNRPENPKDRSGSYDKAQDFDPTEGYDDHPDDQYTSDMVQGEDEFMYHEGHQYEEDDEEAPAQARQEGPYDDEEEEERAGKAQRTGK